MMISTRRTTLTAIALAAALMIGGCSKSPAPDAASSDTDTAGSRSKGAMLRLVVMDPLAAALACDCVLGYAQRDYDALAAFLSKQLDGRPVTVTYAEGLVEGAKKAGGPADLIIGKTSVVLFDARKDKIPVRPIAMLTSKDGTTTFRGLFVVRAGDPATSLADLTPSYRLRIGPKASAEKHDAALATLRDSPALDLAGAATESPGCNIAAINVVERDADVAVISSYAMPLLEGCDTIDRGALRVIGRTAEVPFIGAFVADHVSRHDEQTITAALLAMSSGEAMRVKMESKAGFVAPSAEMRRMADSGGTQP
jgi:ABC-type phosphate/phosphonate transport system substrate-binding protein